MDISKEGQLILPLMSFQGYRQQSKNMNSKLQGDKLENLKKRAEQLGYSIEDLDRMSYSLSMGSVVC